MPIAVQCRCGQSLHVPDASAGRAVKCPKCGGAVNVPAPAGSTAAASAAAPPAPATAPTSGGGGLSDLFDEEGFSTSAQAVCPSCRKEMKPGAVLCTHCGYHTQAGGRVEGHKVAGVDISSGDIQLSRAAESMRKEKELQEKLESGAGFPTWLLALILSILVGVIVIGVMAINSYRQTEAGGGNGFNGAYTLTTFAGVCCTVVAVGMLIKMIIHGFKKSSAEGLLTWFVPGYFLFHGIKYRSEIGKAAVAVLLTATAAIILFFVVGPRTL